MRDSILLETKRPKLSILFYPINNKNTSTLTSANSVFAKLRAEGSYFGILSLIIFSYGLTSSKPPAILATLPGAGYNFVQN